MPQKKTHERANGDKLRQIPLSDDVFKALAKQAIDKGYEGVAPYAKALLTRAAGLPL